MAAPGGGVGFWKMRNMDSEPSNLGQLRLLVALDALLVTGSVGAAARQLGLSPAAASRLLAQIREAIDDPVFIRAGRRLVPSPRAEALRQRVHAVVAEAKALLAPQRDEERLDGPPDPGWIGVGAVQPQVLRIRDSLLAPLVEWPRQEGSGPTFEPGDPRLRMARHLSHLGRSRGQSRPLTAEEAEDAFDLVLRGEADPMQVGGMLLVMNHRIETAPELTGLVRAARRHVAARPIGTGRADLDWPAYISPHARKPPWFLQAAALVAQAGYRVLIHGHSGSGDMRAKLEVAARVLSIPVCTSLDAAERELVERRIAYMPLAAISSQLYRLIALHRLFDARSPVNSLVHLLNPLGAPVGLVGSVRAGYRELHRDAAALLGWPRLYALGAGRDVAEMMPFRPSAVFTVAAGREGLFILPSAPEPPPVRLSGLTTLEYWTAIWAGSARDARARNIIVSTAALALLALEGQGEAAFPAVLQRAEELWETRHRGAEDTHDGHGARHRPAGPGPVLSS